MPWKGAGNMNQEVNRDIEYLYKDRDFCYCYYLHFHSFLLTLISHTIFFFSFSMLEMISVHISQQSCRQLLTSRQRKLRWRALEVWPLESGILFLWHTNKNKDTKFKEITGNNGMVRGMIWSSWTVCHFSWLKAGFIHSPLQTSKFNWKVFLMSTNLFLCNQRYCVHIKILPINI